MSESAKELYFKRGEVILGPDSGTVGLGQAVNTVNGTRVNSVVEAGKSYIITFNSDDPEWANMTLLINPGVIRTPLQQLNSTTYIVKFTATGAERGIGINNNRFSNGLSYTNYTLYEYLPVISGNVLRPFVADKMYYRNQEVQKLYLGSQLVWESGINATRISRGQYEVSPVMKAGQKYEVIINGAIDYIRVTYTDETEEMFSGFSDGNPYSITPMNDIKLIKVYKNYSSFDPESIVINAK